MIRWPRQKSATLAWRNRRRPAKAQSGFTIVELILATTIFSIVITVAISGFIGIGRLFYRGAIATANQQTSRTVSDDVRGDMAMTSVISSVKKVTANGGTIRYYCIGNNRYTFQLGKPVDLGNHDHTANFGLLRDSLPGNAGCANPFDQPGAVPIADNAAELLSNNMRINIFCITPDTNVSYGNLYQINLNIATGADQYLTFITNPNPSDCAAPSLADCNSALKTSTYCAKSDLTTSVAAISTTLVEDTTCPTGYTGTYPNCTPPTPKTCPTGYTGTYPNCIPPQCPSGYTGTYPNCVPPPKTYQLTIEATGSGSGTIGAEDPSTSSQYLRFYYDGKGTTSQSKSFNGVTDVRIGVGLDSDSTFGGYSGCDSTSGSFCIIRVDGTKTVTVRMRQR